MPIYDRKYWIDFGEFGDKLDQVAALINASKLREEKMSAQLDALKAQITAIEGKVGTTVDKQQEAILLLNRLSAEIQAIKEDPLVIAALQAQVSNISATLQASTDALGAAVTANTPAIPAP